MPVNKFHIDWQIVRVKARTIKNVDDKILFVKTFLIENNSYENKMRVKNWAIMTRMGYRIQSIKQLFTEFLVWIDSYSYDKLDLPNDFSKHDFDDLLKVHKDLSKRKYGFQYSKVPTSHINFMRNLESYIESYSH